MARDTRLQRFQTYHADELPEGAEIDVEGVATIAEIEEAGQAVLPLETTGEFKITVMTREREAPEDCCWNVGTSHECRYTGTYAECAAVVDRLRPAYPRATYAIAPVAPGSPADGLHLAIAT